MNPRLVGLFALSFLLSAPASASVSSVEWLDLPDPFQADTVQRHVVSATEVNYFQLWTIPSRDSVGRPLHARLETRIGAFSLTADYSYSWAFDLELATGRGRRPCPSRLVVAYGDTSGPVRSDTSWFDWNLSTRSLIERHSSAFRKCSWADSSVLDPQGRTIEQTSCRLQIANGTDSIATWTRVRRGFANDQALHPRWLTILFADSLPREKDSVSVQGPDDHPTHAILVSLRYSTPTDGIISTGTDSLLWNPSGELRSLTRWSSPGTGSALRREKATEFTWEQGRVKTKTQISWDLNDEAWSSVSTYLYSLDLSSSTPRSPRAVALRRIADGRVSLTLPTSGPASVEWIAPDGRRVQLHDGPASRGSLDLAVPRGIGFLRVRQGGQTRTHTLPSL
jgi:hypothetical protein